MFRADPCLVCDAFRRFILRFVSVRFPPSLGEIVIGEARWSRVDFVLVLDL